MTFANRIAFFVFALCVISGRSQAQEIDRPFVLHLPGIGGQLAIDHWMTDGLRDGREIELDIYDWTGDSRGLEALLNVDRNLAQANLIAERIEKFVRQNPTRPFHLVGHSGGTGIAVWALERLPEDVQIESLTMLASALSPSYDLSAALARVKRAYAFNSRLDTIVLGLGTKALGTIDGVQTEAAGCVGFTMPAGADAAQCAKLVQFPYQLGWIRLGHIGDHIGVMGVRFSRGVLAPLIFDGESPAAEEKQAAEDPENTAMKN